MVRLKEFRLVNHLTQTELGKYLGENVDKSFISQIEKGTRKMPPTHLAKLLQNTEGWDVSMLYDSEGVYNVSVSQAESGGTNFVQSGHGVQRNYFAQSDKIAILEKENEMLRELLKEEKERSQQYWELIKELKK